MNISLTPELTAFVAQKVDAGDYRDATDVIQESLRLFKELEEQDRAASSDLPRNIQAGIEQADRGDLEDVDEGIMDRIRTAGQKILAHNRKTG